MPEIESLVRSRLALLLFFLAAAALAEEPFWVVRQEPLKETSWVAFVPAKKELAKQAVLVYASLPPSEQPPEIRHILGEMYSQVDGLKILGRKPVTWREGEGTLVSFSGRSDSSKVLGRAVIAATEHGTEVLMLVRHPQSDARIVKSFDQVRQDIEPLLSRVKDKKPKE